MFKSFLILPLLSCLAVKGPVNPDPVVGTITIFAYSDFVYYGNSSDDYEIENRGLLTGHVFLEIKNTTSSTLTVGHISLSSNQKVTISCWPNMNGFPHSGLWYNRESFDLCGWNYNGHASLTTNITQIGVDGINSYMTTSSNNYYDLINHSCGNASVEIWNSVIDDPNKVISTSHPNLPSYVRGAIQSLNGATSLYSYTINTSCGYVNASGGYTAYV